MTQLVVLSLSGCLAFKGKRSLGEGYMGDQALGIIARLEGHRLWASTEATITACPIMLMEAQHILVKARDFIRKQRIQKLTGPKLTTLSAVPKVKEKTSKDQGTRTPGSENVLGRQVLGQEVGRGVRPTHPHTMDHRRAAGEPHTPTTIGHTLLLRGGYRRWAV